MNLPRGFADENQVVNNLTHNGRTSRGFWLSGYKSNNHNVEYLSLKESQEVVSKLEDEIAQLKKKYCNLMRASHGVVKWFTPEDPEHPVAKLKSEWEKIKNEDILLEVQRNNTQS